jgi:Flp pilus assembly protein TadD
MKPKLIKTLILALVIVFLVLGGAYAGYRGYKSIRQSRLNAQAREHLEKQDYRKAQLCLQRAVRYNNRNLDTCRLMAQLAEASRSPAALIWRARVVELSPGNLEDQLALARAALPFRDYATATNALAKVDAKGRQTPEYHNVAGGVAAAAGLATQAEAHFREASKLDPQSAFFRLSLAVVQLSQTNAPALTEGRMLLKSISVNPTNASLRCQALRELVVDALRHNQAEIAQTLSRQLLQETNSIFRDRLLRLEVLRETKSDQFKPALVAFQREVGTNTGNIYELGMWQMTKLGTSANLNWLRTLPRETQNQMPTAMLIADCLADLRDWKGLQAAVDSQTWGELEFLRRALKARALRGQNLVGAAKGEWELALKVAGDPKASPNPKSSMVMLMRLAAQWEWLSEAEDILWSIVRGYPGEEWAVQALTQTLYTQGRTRPLMMLYTQELQRAPRSLSVKNNLALTALLLEANELKPHDLAREVYHAAPTNAAYASTYAYSLYLQGKNPEALKIMQTLKAKELEDPSIAGYYGLILKKSGDREKANTYLNWGLKAALLKEERAIFERAKSG